VVRAGWSRLGLFSAVMIVALAGCTSPSTPGPRATASDEPRTPTPASTVAVLAPVPDCKQFQPRIAQLMRKVDKTNGGPVQQNPAEMISGSCDIYGELAVAGTPKARIYVDFGRHAENAGSPAAKRAELSVSSWVRSRCDGEAHDLGWPFEVSKACSAPGPRPLESIGVADGKGNYADVEVAVLEDRPKDADALRKAMAPAAQQLVRDVFAQL
jgi:hypothetical protein